jgi:hypothetical protein
METRSGVDQAPEKTYESPFPAPQVAAIRPVNNNFPRRVS